MKRLVPFVVLIGLFVGAYFQELSGHPERLPAWARPTARCVDARVLPLSRVWGAKVVSWAKAAGHAVGAGKVIERFEKAAAAEASRPPCVPASAAPPPQPEIVRVIVYDSAPDLLRQLRSVAKGQQVELRPAPNATGIPNFKRRPGENCSQANDRYAREMAPIQANIDCEFRRINGNL